MDSRWNDGDAAEHVATGEAKGVSPDLALRIYTSRLIGRDPDLVLHGGGNTSVKIGAGTDEGVLHVKGSGWDLGEIDAPGLPALRLDPLLAARSGNRMSDDKMVAFLRDQLLDSGSPNPSVETLLHAFLPHRFVDHCHATAVLALADQEDMTAEVERIFDGRLAFVPYVMPGYDLAVEADRVFRDNPYVEGLWLEKHGIFTFGDTAQESYERTIRFVSRAEEELVSCGAPVSGPQATDRAVPEALTELLRTALREHGGLGKDPALDFRSTPSIRAYLAQSHLSDLAARGTATPDHVIRLKPQPMILDAGADAATVAQVLERYISGYRDYFTRNEALADEPKTMLDPLPRAVLVSGEGIFGLGRTAKEARIVGDLWEQTARIVLAAESWGRFAPISERNLFDMEYWSLEQAKLSKA